MERGAVGCLSNVFMTVEWRTRDFLCAALLISFGEEVAGCLAGCLLSNGRRSLMNES